MVELYNLIRTWNMEHGAFQLGQNLNGLPFDSWRVEIADWLESIFKENEVHEVVISDLTVI